MQMRLTNTIWCAALVLTGLTAGCITNEETIYKDEGRIPVSFENDKAARLFYEALSKHNTPQDRDRSTTEVHIPVVFKHKQTVIRGENSQFNNAVRQADTDHDGKITEQEARIYSEMTEHR